METVAPGPSALSRERVPGPGVFHVRRGSLADTLGDRLRGRGEWVAGLAVWTIGYLVLAAIIVGLGLLLIHLLLPAGLGSVDAHVSEWLARRRTPTLNAITVVGSEIGSTGEIVVLAALAVVVLAVKRYWHQLAFIVCALSLEFAVFLTATLVIDRNRPGVPRLDPSPVTSSYPSGHAAASLTLYVAIAIVVSSLVRSAWARTVVWIVAVAVPVIVAVSRVYRGMHHLTDVLASVLVAFGALLFAVLSLRTAMAASSEIDEPTAGEPSDDPVLEAAS